MAEKKESSEIEKLYKLLSAPITDKEAVQRSEGAKTGKGYDTTGFGYQFIVNRFNEVLGIGNWGWEFESLKEFEGKYKTGTPFYAVTGLATIFVIVNGQKTSHSEYGGHQSISYTDALKGASTNAFKKTAAFFGVGKQAFEKTIDEDNLERVKDEVKKVASVTTPEQNKTKKTLEQTLLMIDVIATEKAIDVWEQQLEKTDAWTDVQKRVIKGRLDARRIELKK